MNLTPHVHELRIVVERDDNPDLSHLADPSNYAGVPPEDAARYMAEDAARIDAYNKGEWWMVGIYAEATIRFRTEQGGWISGPAVRSGGLWGIESDSGGDFMQEIASEEVDKLADLLAALNIRESLHVDKWEER